MSRLLIKGDDVSTRPTLQEGAGGYNFIRCGEKRNILILNSHYVNLFLSVISQINITKLIIGSKNLKAATMAVRVQLCSQMLQIRIQSNAMMGLDGEHNKEFLLACKCKLRKC